MKKLILTLAIIISTISVATAQRNAIGVRVGYGAEISYQRSFARMNRLEIDLGASRFQGNFHIAGIYQWVWKLSKVAHGLRWYVGPGVSLGAWSKNFAFGINGQIGLEYKFKFPFAISLDWRPGYIVATGKGNDPFFYWEGFALGLRYTF